MARRMTELKRTGRPAEEPVERGDGVHSVEKAIALLYAFDHVEPELGVMELSRRLRLHKSTVSRLLSTLETGGLVERNAETGRYRLGVELIALSGRVARHADLRTIARPFLEELALQGNETVNLVVLHNGAAMNIEQFVPAERQVKEIGWVGRRTPLHATSTGKVLLAYLSSAEQQQILSTLELFPLTPQTITDRARLAAELEQVQRQGYALGLEELEVGLYSVAAPVRDHTGNVVATVSISGPAYRLPMDQLPHLAQAVQRTANQISRAMGGPLPALN